MDKITQDKISSISIIRVIAMLSIILGHYLMMKNIYTYQLLSIGVEIFLLVSGYLYGTRGGVFNAKTFFAGRFRRIILPMWITLILNMILRTIFGLAMEWKGFLTCFFNLQGVSFILLDFKISCVSGLGQTWFLTVIIICYVFTYFLKKHSAAEEKIIAHWKIWLSAALILQIVLAYIGIQISYFLEFFIGYFLAKIKIEKNTGLAVKITCCTVLCCIIRVLARKSIDGTIFYDHVIARISFNVLALWIVLFQVYLCKKYKNFFDNLADSKIWRVMDIMSFPMYLCHYMFCAGELAVVHWCNGNAWQIVLFSVFTIVMAGIVVLFTDRKKMADLLGLDKL